MRFESAQILMSRRKRRCDLVLEKYFKLLEEGKVRLEYTKTNDEHMQMVRFKLRRISSKRRRPQIIISHHNLRPNVQVCFRYGKRPYYLGLYMALDLYRYAMLFGVDVPKREPE